MTTRESPLTSKPFAAKVTFLRCRSKSARAANERDGCIAAPSPLAPHFGREAFPDPAHWLDHCARTVLQRPVSGALYDSQEDNAWHIGEGRCDLNRHSRSSPCERAGRLGRATRPRNLSICTWSRSRRHSGHE